MSVYYESCAIKIDETPKDLVIECRTITLCQGEVEIMADTEKRLESVRRTIINGATYEKK